jgi:transposase-like protein
MVFEARASTTIAVGGDRVDRRQDRLHGRDLRRWVRQHERDTGQREGLTTAEAQRVKELERENRELRKANEILKLASAFFAQAELDRRLK